MKATLEVVILPVSDVDKALDFYRDKLGFTLDVDYTPTPDFRVAQLTPPGSSTSIQFGLGLTDAQPGSVQGLYLVVDDIVAVREELVDHGVGVTSIRHKNVDDGQWRVVVSTWARIHAGPITPASPTSTIRTATPGSFRSVATAMNDRPAVLVFDVNETLIDITSLEPLFETVFGDRSVLREWFNQLVMYSMTATLSDNYVDFFTLGQAVLRMIGDTRHVLIADGDLDELAYGMRTMPAHSDVADGLAKLRAHGYRLVTLTNSPPRPGAPTPLESAGLAQFFEKQFSVDTWRVFKPSPRLYTGVAEQLGVVATDCMMVAAHVWDTIGAQSAGFRGALITRPGNAALPSVELPQPDVVVADLEELVERLG